MNGYIHVNRSSFQICTSTVFRNSKLTIASTFKRMLPCQVFSSCDFGTQLQLGTRHRTMRAKRERN